MDKGAERLRKWCKKVEGRQAALARSLGISQAAISKMETIPPRRVLAIEKFTGIKRHLLASHIYPKENN